MSGNAANRSKGTSGIKVAEYYANFGERRVGDPIEITPASFQGMITVRRRDLIRNFGAMALMAPFVGLTSRAARAAPPSGFAKRLILFFSPHGTIHRFWLPNGSERSFELPAGSILEPLSRRKSDLVIIDGLDFKNGDNHEGGMSAMLTGHAGASTESQGASVDQYIRAKLGDDARSLELGVLTSPWGASTQTRMSYSSAGSFVHPLDRPAEVYRQLFSDVAGGSSAAQQRLVKRRSVLDLVRGEIGQLKSQIGAEEGHKLETHLEALRRVELGLTGGSMTPGAACAPPSPFTMDPMEAANFPAVGRAQTDLLVAALACGKAQVASLQWSHTVSPVQFSWLNISSGHHDLSHKGDSENAGVNEFVRAQRWFAEQFLYLLDRLAELPEPGQEGSMLDHSLVAWVTELGDPRAHTCRQVPFVLAGKAGGWLTTGRYLRYPGESHQKLLTSMCRAMGLETPYFGDPAVATGELAGLKG